MTVASQVKQCVASLKNVEATLNHFAIQSQDREAANIFKDACLTTRRIVVDLERRVGELEFEEPQYKGF
ncbi:Protein of unknown function [Evansella caseinilytica]|uniref:DUF1657 domain-containing protein n=1 Tax=Evansella caseinilytica TaxID=1503961 RepID=A0A1H3GWU2_9BACI|nr:DUF1657 domain-containing protein [Evansella caseinilytica]SDY07701.1 Protein of unknown function [Evansella caseinilytica]